MRVLLAQINPIVGDVAGNTQKILQRIAYAQTRRVELVVFPELALSGYPPEDFLHLPHFIQAIESHLEKIVAASKDIAVVVDLDTRTTGRADGIALNRYLRHMGFSCLPHGMAFAQVEGLRAF